MSYARWSLVYYVLALLAAVATIVCAVAVVLNLFSDAAVATFIGLIAAVPAFSVATAGFVIGGRRFLAVAEAEASTGPL